MARPPVGIRAQPLSDTAIAAHVALRLAGVGSNRQAQAAWLKERLGVLVGSNGARRAGPRAAPALRPWVLVREGVLPLDLETALVVFPGRGRRRDRLVRHLRELGPTRQLLVTRSRRDVFCVLLFRRQDREGVFHAVEALGEDFVWEEITHEDRALEGTAWMCLAQRIARDEALLGPLDARQQIAIESKSIAS